METTYRQQKVRVSVSVSVSGDDVTSSGTAWTGSSAAVGAGVLSVGQIRAGVDLPLDPGGEMRHVAVDAGSQHLAEAHAAPRRQAEQRPARTRVLAHQRAAAVTLDTAEGRSQRARATVPRERQTLPCRSPPFQRRIQRKAFWE